LHHEVHAIVFQREEELRRETEGYKVPDSVRIYSPLDDAPPRSLFDKLPRRMGPGLQYRWLRRSWAPPGPVAAGKDSLVADPDERIRLWGKV